MDPVSAGASVLAIVGFALQGTKVLYESISGVKDAPQRIKSLASAVADLRSVLTQLELCRALADPDADLQNVTSLIQACSRDVQRYRKSIDSIQIIPTDTKVKQSWKRLKTVLKKDDVKQVWQEVNHHCTVLGVQLSLLQSNTTSLCKDKIVKLQSAFSDQAVHDQRQTTLLLQRTEDVSTINNNLQGFKTSTIDHIRDTVTSIAQKLENAPSRLETQSEDIFTLLKAIQAQISGSSTQSNVAQRSSSPRRHSSGDVDDERFTDEYPKLHESLTRLCQLDFGEGRTWHNEEADGIINDLHLLLESISTLHQHSGRRKLGKRKVDSTDTYELNDRVLKRLCGIVTASQSVDTSLAEVKKVTQKRGDLDVSTSFYKAKISITERRITFERDSDSDSTKKTDMIETITRVKAFVRHRDLNNVLVAQIRQFQLSTGFSCRNPFVSVGKTLPDDSPIFSIVENGNVEALQQLLSRGEATLRDKDSWGTPLLHEKLKMTFHLARPFIDLNPTSYEDPNPLLELAKGEYDPHRFKFLLDAGSNIHARDVDGRTCLHLAILGVDRPWYEVEYSAPNFLIQRGADIFSKDSFGHSISHDAYTRTNEDVGGYRGDLWDAVLSYCGFDICKLRKGYPRTPQYGDFRDFRDYTREDFERLWKGREDQCPYFHDPPIWRSPLSSNPEDDVDKSELEEVFWSDEDSDDDLTI
ncbi:hypothetical protein BU16DRAFT_622574 [Lophium mytilinum]|uniref:Azaphilone pigments biosynthesis cluster protein L N-terminal domain-containing protein n=1 Tax=Lophium mytilinum TaxID=390894 RepID=A0A6A6QDF1_9PEZI|nr:hypothetical protein BU16DRAFT_622574 [Lophium mytilinum]